MTSILNEKSTFKEKNICVKSAANQGHITLATRSFGRGTDFICNDNTVLENGGVHVIITFFPESIAEEIQLIGRTGR
jgi:preprotein translocase subunit SecA